MQENLPGRRGTAEEFVVAGKKGKQRPRGLSLLRRTVVGKGDDEPDRRRSERLADRRTVGEFWWPRR